MTDHGLRAQVTDIGIGVVPRARAQRLEVPKTEPIDVVRPHLIENEY
jgi:hypothetical protein